MADSIERTCQKAFDLGKKYEMECTGCAQTTLAAVFETLGMWNEDVFRSASGLADGLGLTGDGACGALNGAALAIGYVFGRERQDFSDMLKPLQSYLLCKRLHDEFVAKYGTCRCYDIQTRLMGRTFNLYDPGELQEAREFGMFDHCSDLVGETARLVVRIILEETEKNPQR